MLVGHSARRLLTPATKVGGTRRPLHKRAIKLENRHPAFRDFASDLISLPLFRTRGDDVRVIYEPHEFYDTLLHRIAHAKRRIFIASLYVGKEEAELIQTLHDALAANPRLEVTILLDYLRSTRENPKPCSASLVASLVAAFPKQVRLSLYHTPELTGWRKKLVPRRFDEGWGLQHIKCYGFDDDVLISGANLSGDYFSNRQDRYIEFLSNPPLADYFSSLLDTISSYSFSTIASDTSSKYPALDITWPSDNGAASPLATNTSIADFKSAAQYALRALTQRWARKPASSLYSTRPIESRESQTFDTTLRPVLQMGSFSVQQETALVVPSIFKAGNSLATAPGGAKTRIDWTSGYFSVQEGYKEQVLASRAQVRIVSASPEANGFFKSRGVSKYIPPAYTYFQSEFYEQLRASAKRKRKESHVEMREWKRTGWTYHAKGIWLTPALSALRRHPLGGSPQVDINEHDSDAARDSFRMPYLTLVGSSNYGRRSAERDLEANVLVTTTSLGLRRDLQEEISQIRKYAVDPVNESLFARSDRKVPWGVKVAARTIESML